MGRAQEALGESAEAERSYQSAIERNRKGVDPEGEAIALGNLGALYLSLGRYSSALDRFAEMDALAQRHAREPWTALQAAVARINRGVVLERVGARREALDLYRQLLDDPASLDPRQRAALLVSTGVLYRNLGDPVRAESALREAMDLFQRQGDEAGLSNADLNLGLALHLNLARPRAAEAAFREALARARASGDRTEEVLDLFYLGRLLLEVGKLDEAQGAFERCLEIARASGSAEGEWSALDGLGRVAQARGDLEGALRKLERAVGKIEEIRSALTSRSQRAGYFGDKREVYAATIGVLAELHRKDRRPRYDLRAFDLVQQAKARDLFDSLHIAQAPSARSEPERARVLMSRLGELGKRSLLEYFLTDTRLLLFEVHADSFGLYDLGGKAPVLAEIAEIHRALAHGQTPNAATVSRLSRRLLSRVSSEGRQEGDPSPLYVAGDGLLRYLPFELLDDPRDPGRRLIERTAITYLPSGSNLGDLGSLREAYPELRFLGIGATVPPPGTAGAKTLAGLLAERFHLAPLPGAERELDAARAVLGGRSVLLTGPNATEAKLRAALQQEPKVLHVASHTVIDERQGAAILLTPEGKDDGLLDPAEIAGLPRSGALTILAACKTSLADDDEGRALTSLTGAFLASGSSAVIATLWDVGDADTEVFMAQLYAHLGRGEAPAEALRQAKLTMLKDERWKSPARWAGYVIVGDAGPVAPKPKRWEAWAGVAMLGMGLVGWLRIRAQKNTDSLKTM